METESSLQSYYLEAMEWYFWKTRERQVKARRRLCRGHWEDGGSWESRGFSMGDFPLSIHLDEFMVTLVTELLQHTLSLAQLLTSSWSLLQLQVQGSHEALGVTPYFSSRK